MALCLTFQSCNKESVSNNLLLGTWELDHSEYKTPNGEVFTKKWDARQILTFKETLATFEYTASGEGSSTNTIPFAYYYENGVIHYNSVIGLSYEGESV